MARVSDHTSDGDKLLLPPVAGARMQCRQARRQWQVWFPAPVGEPQSRAVSWGEGATCHSPEQARDEALAWAWALFAASCPHAAAIRERQLAHWQRCTATDL